jgi:DNA polymerase-3 subunit delta'
MHTACANKLLKLIEEPPNKTLFILITEDEEDVIGTIRSRAQLVKFPFIENEAIKAALLEIENVDTDLIPDAVNLANGNFIKAKAYLNPGEDEQFYFQKFQEMMRQAYKREVLEQIQWADEMAKIGRDKQKAFFAFALRMIREYFVMNMKENSMVYLNQNEKAWGKQFAPFINERNITAFFNEFEKGITHISWNGNPRIIFLDTALRTVRLIKR